MWFDTRTRVSAIEDPILFSKQTMRSSHILKNVHIQRRKKKTSRTEFGQQMRSGDLPTYLSLNGPTNGSFMLLMLFCSILALMSFRWRSIMFSVLYCFISVEISEIQLVCDGRTDRRTDGRTDRPTKRLIESRARD